MNDETREGDPVAEDSSAPRGTPDADADSDAPEDRDARRRDGLDGFFDRLRQIDVRRDTEGKWIGGVCVGIANRIRIDPVLVRLGVILLVFFGGVGIGLYLMAWVLLPTRSGDIVAERAVKHGDVGAILLCALAAFMLVTPFFDGAHVGVWWPVWFLVLAGVVYWLWTSRGDKDDGRPYAAPYGAATPPPPPPPAGAGMTYAASSPTHTAAAGRADSPGEPGVTPPPGGGAPRAAGTAAYGPPPPPRPRVRRAGFLTGLVVVGLALAAYGVVLVLHDAANWAGSDHVLGLAAAAGVAGLATLGLGLTGVRSGFTGFAAAVLAVMTAVAALVSPVDWGNGFGERAWHPRTAESRTYELTGGEARLDLRDYPTDPERVETLRVHVGGGELTLIVPDDLTVELRADVDAGTVTVDGRDLGTSAAVRDDSGVSVHETYGGGPTDVVVDAEVSFGEIRVVTGERALSAGPNEPSRRQEP